MMPAEKLSSSTAISPITGLSLGNRQFKKEFNLRYAYAAGGMYMGISSKELVVKMARAGMLSFFGSGGLKLESIEDAILYLKNELGAGEPYGINFLSNHIEAPFMELLLKHEVNTIEAASFIKITAPLVKYRLKGLEPGADGTVIARNRIIAKISRPEVAERFLSPAPGEIVTQLLQENQITKLQAELSAKIPMADHLCVESDSGGHTDQGVAYTLMPAMLALRNKMAGIYRYSRRISIGAAGGIGTPEAAAAAFILGADFILTGSINQCTVESGASQSVKEMLQRINVQDTDYAPAGDMFETGSKVQVLKKGVFFPARANKLYSLYRLLHSIEELDVETRAQIEERYFKKSFEDVYQDVRQFHPPAEIIRADRDPKHKMALLFRWYFGHSTRLALMGNRSQRVDYQVQCGPALGAFNQWVKGTTLEDWKNRHVDHIAIKIMEETADLLNLRLHSLCEEE